MDDLPYNQLEIYRRHLPHWRMKGALYFVTFRAISGELSFEEQILVMEHIKNGDDKYYKLMATMVMPDHVHILLSPIGNISLSRIMKGIKGVSAKKLNIKRGESGSIWQNEFFDRIIRDENELYEKINYMLFNPVTKKLTENPWDYHGWYLKKRF